MVSAYNLKKTDFNIFLDPNDVEHIIQNGVKETKTPGDNGDLLSTIEWMEENNSGPYTGYRIGRNFTLYHFLKIVSVLFILNDTKMFINIFLRINSGIFYQF